MQRGFKLSYPRVFITFGGPQGQSDRLGSLSY